MTDGRFAINMHILTLLASARQVSGEDWLTSDFMAASINIHPVLVRKELAGLRRAGLVQSREGKNGGSALAKPATEILISDIYRLVYDRSVLGLAKNTPNPKCPVGAVINDHLTALYNDAEAAMMTKFAGKNLHDFVQQFF